MAAKKKAADAKVVRAAVLFSDPTYGLSHGDVFEAEQSVMDGQVAIGNVDPHPDAVAAALAAGAKVITQPTEEAAPAAAAETAAE